LTEAVSAQHGWKRSPFITIAERISRTLAGAVSKPIEMCDDDLRLTMFPKRLAVKVDPAPPRWEMFKLDQLVAENGLPVATIGPIVKLTPFDPWGHRTFSMMTNNGVANVIRGLTTVTPLWSRIESQRVESHLAAKAYLWDMRIATSSIPRDLLSKILLKQIGLRNAPTFSSTRDQRNDSPSCSRKDPSLSNAATAARRNDQAV
jgi:hypothetical protein